jgi:hypothetical protein
MGAWINYSIDMLKNYLRVSCRLQPRNALELVHVKCFAIANCQIFMYVKFAKSAESR